MPDVLSVEFMNDYKKVGGMYQIETPEVNNLNYYMPHHGVLHKESLTTKLRVVYEG